MPIFKNQDIHRQLWYLSSPEALDGLATLGLHFHMATVGWRWEECIVHFVKDPTAPSCLPAAFFTHSLTCLTSLTFEFVIPVQPFEGQRLLRVYLLLTGKPYVNLFFSHLSMAKKTELSLSDKILWKMTMLSCGASLFEVCSSFRVLSAQEPLSLLHTIHGVPQSTTEQPQIWPMQSS